jgi:hypothetical protein
MINIKIKYLALLAVIPLFTTGLDADYFSNVYAERNIEGDFECFRGKVLVHRFSHGNFMCVSPSTAERWEQIGLAEKITNANISTLCTEVIGTDKKPSPLANEHPMKNMITGDIKCIRADRVATLLIKDWTLLGVTSQFQLGIQAQATECEAGLVQMQETKTGTRACVTPDQVNFLLLADWHTIGERTAQVVDLACKVGTTHMQNPQSGKEICATSDQIEELTHLGWKTLSPEKKLVPKPTVDAQSSVSPITLTAEQSAYDTVTSAQDPGIGHETHQLAILLPPSDQIYDGELSFSASEPVQVVILIGPLGPGDDKGQPIWTTDGEQKYGLVLIDKEKKSGSVRFTGNAIAFHSMNEEPFAASYDMVFRELKKLDTVKVETIDSVKDPVETDEKLQLAIILPRTNNIYHGSLAFTASEPVQIVALHGPLSKDQIQGQPTWSPDGVTIYGVTVVGSQQNMGDYKFTARAVGVHTNNDTPFTVTYAVAAKSIPSGN